MKTNSSGVTALQYVEERKKEQARRLRKESAPVERILWEGLRQRGAAEGRGEVMKTNSSGVTALQYVEETKKEQARRLRKESTPAERILWERLRNRQVAGLKFRRQQIIDGFIADFYCERAKLAVEVDGNVHDEEERKKIDEHREKVFMLRGIHTVRLRNSVVINSIDNCITSILKAAERNLIPPPLLPHGEGEQD